MDELNTEDSNSQRGQVDSNGKWDICSGGWLLGKNNCSTFWTKNNKKRCVVSCNRNGGTREVNVDQELVNGYGFTEQAMVRFTYNPFI